MKEKKLFTITAKRFFSRFLFASTLNKVSAKKTEKYQGQVK